MGLYNAITLPNRSARSRRCKSCKHVNAASYLVCQRCKTVLTGSDWVDIPSRVVLETQKHRTGELAKASNNTPEPRQSHTSKETAPDEPVKPKQDPSQVVFSRAALGMPSLAKQSPKPDPEPDAPRQTQQINLYSTGNPTWNHGGTSVFEATMLLGIEISDSNQPPLVLRLPQQRALTIGRDEPDSRQRPDIDLIPYGGFKKGISRLHASLELNGKRLELRDLKSSNGTFLNGIKLDPHDSHQLRDGDLIRMGNMSLRITFKA